MGRSYDQFCPLAFALERVGERWTGLILRSLAAGPKRYTDLNSELPGIGTSILATRLRTLETDGLIARRASPPPTPAALYELTPTGRELFRALLPLAAWGGRHMTDGRPARREQIPLSSVAVSLHATFDPARAEGVSDTYQFTVDDRVLTVEVHDSELQTREGPAANPDVTIVTDSQTLYDVAFGRSNPDQALTTGAMTVTGDPEAIQRCHRLLGPNRLSASTT